MVLLTSHNIVELNRYFILYKIISLKMIIKTKTNKNNKKSDKLINNMLNELINQSIIQIIVK